MKTGAIDWKKVNLLEEPGTKVPAMVEHLAGTNARKAKDALSFFVTELVHQSTPTPGATVVAPLLAELACRPKSAHRGPLFTLLGTLAANGEPRAFLWATTPPSVPRALRAAALSCRGEACARLGDAAAGVRTGAAYLLSFVGDAASLSALRARVATEKHPIARAAMLMAVTLLRGPKEHADDALLTAALAARDPALRLAGVYGLARGGPLEPRTRTAALTLVDAKQVAGFPWKNGDVSGLAFEVLRAVAVRDGDASALLKLLETRGNRVVSELIDLLLPGRVDVKKLSLAQRDFIAALSEDDGLYGIVHKRLVSLGLPALARDARRALGLGADEPLEVEHVVSGKRATLLAHLQAAAKSSQLRAPLAKVLTKGATADQVIGLCKQVLRAELKGEDADGVPATERVVLAVLESFPGAQLLPLLRTFAVNDELQVLSGHSVMMGRLSAPFAMTLAKRTKSGDEARLRSLAASEFDKAYWAPLWTEMLRALDVKRREKLLQDAAFDWSASGFRLDGVYVPVLLETPTQVLAARMVGVIEIWIRDYGQARTGWSNGFVTEKLGPAQLKKLSPKDHPRAAVLEQQVRAFVVALRGKKLEKQAVAIEKKLEKFLSM